MTKSSMGMATTFGSAALLDAFASENAAVVDLVCGISYPPSYQHAY
jgi:hypothetical protein